MALKIWRHYRAWLGFPLLIAVSPIYASCTLLIVGDSLSSGYGLTRGTSWVDHLSARLAQRRNGWQVINASISGDTTQNGLQRLVPALKRHTPDIVLIELGGNDALRGIPPEAIRNNVRAMIKKAKQSGARVALFAIPVLPNYGKAYADTLSRLYQQLAREENITLVPCFVCGVASQPGMMQADGIHPTEAAQKALLEAVWKPVQPLLHCPAK